MSKCEGGFEIRSGPCRECGATERDGCRRAPNWQYRAEQLQDKLDNEIKTRVNAFQLLKDFEPYLRHKDNCTTPCSCGFDAVIDLQPQTHKE